MVVVQEPTSKKLLSWLQTVLDTGKEYQTFLKNIKVKERPCLTINIFSFCWTSKSAIYTDIIITHRNSHFLIFRMFERGKFSLFSSPFWNWRIESNPQCRCWSEGCGVLTSLYVRCWHLFSRSKYHLWKPGRLRQKYSIQNRIVFIKLKCSIW